MIKLNKKSNLEDKGICTQENELELGDENTQILLTPNIRHPPVPNGPHVIEDNELPYFLRTWRSRHKKLYSAVDISNSCPTPKQAASGTYPLIFLFNFAGSILDTETGELLEYTHLIKHPRPKDERKFSFGNKIGKLEQGMP